MKLRKETRGRQVEDTPHGKWYDDACGTAFAMELVGERWSLLIVRELLLGPLRFSDLRAALPGISAKVLTERLEGLDRAGILTRKQLAPPSSVQVYELTPWGYLSETAVMELGRWAASSPRHDPLLPLSAASLMLSLRTMFRPDLAEGVATSGDVRIGREQFRVAVNAGALTAERGAADAPQFILSAPKASPAAVAIHGKVPVEVLAESGLELSGDRQAFDSFVGCFRMPDKVG